MSVARLTKDIREAVERRIRLDAFCDERAAIGECERALGDDIYRSIIPEAVEKAAYKLPDGWVANTDGTALYFGSGRDYRLVSWNRQRPIPHSWAYGVKERVDDDSLIQRHNALRAELDAVKLRTDELVAEARRVLMSVGTIKQLLEVWPEAEELLPVWATTPKQSAAVPAIVVADLNVKLREARVPATAVTR